MMESKSLLAQVCGEAAGQAGCDEAISMVSFRLNQRVGFWFREGEAAGQAGCDEAISALLIRCDDKRYHG